MSEVTIERGVQDNNHFLFFVLSQGIISLGHQGASVGCQEVYSTWLWPKFTEPLAGTLIALSQEK